MTTLSVTFDRASLSLPALIISNDPFAGGVFWLPEDGVGEIARALRRTYAPQSAWVAGQRLLAAVSEAATLPLAVYARAESSAALAAARAELDAAVGQWDYDLTVTVDGVATTYRAEPEVPQWPSFDSGMVAAHMDRASLAIPLNPA